MSGWITWNGDTETVECRFWGVGSTSGDGGNLEGRRVELGVVKGMSLRLFWLFLWNNLRRWSIWLKCWAGMGMRSLWGCWTRQGGDGCHRDV